MIKCDYCGRENAETNATCAECGTDLPRAPGTPPPLPDQMPLHTAHKHMKRGGTVFAFGSLMTVITYVMADAGGLGFYVVWWGAMFGGLADFLYGFANRHQPSDQLDKREAEDAAYETLAQAARLETQGQQAAALALYQKIAEQHPDTPVGWDALASIKNLRPPVS
jgi:hypothetical protein